MHLLRRLLRAPGFTSVTLITLALGIGANTAIFSVVEGILLKPLPFREPDRLVGVWHTSAKMNLKKFNASPATYLTYREQGSVFEDIGLWTGGSVGVTKLSQPEQVPCLYVTDGTLPLLGVQPERGRFFTKEEAVSGGPRTTVLAWGYWQRRFAGSPSAIGKHIVADGEDYEIVGILPRNFRFMEQKADLVLPLQFNRAKIVVGNFSYQAVARLKPGVTLQQANADVARLIPLSLHSFPPPPGFSIKVFEDAKLGPNVTWLKDDLVGEIRDVLWILLGTLAAVLLIACANVANLLLVRAEGRQHELAIRMALGAGRGSIARELLSESMLLGLMGGVPGLGVAFLAIRMLVAIGPDSLPRLGEISIDLPVLLFTLVVSLTAGLLFGLLPVFRYAGSRLGEGLRESGRALSHSRSRIRARNVLVVFQVALAVVLLVSSGLMIRTFTALRGVNPGFTKPAEILTMRVAVPEGDVKEPARAFRMDNDMLEKISRIPGVSAAGMTSSLTMDGNHSGDVLFAEDHPVTEGVLPAVRNFKFASPGYFSSMGIGLVAGRDMTWTDLYNFRPVAVISENLAREYWRSPSAALGKRIREGSKSEWREVIGVVADERDEGVEKPAPKTIYWPMMMKNFWNNETFLRRDMALAIRSSRTGSATLPEQVRQAVWAVSPNSPVAEVRTMDELYRKSMARTSFTLVMLSIAGAMALLLGLVGIYGVIAYTVAQRRREIGIRMALGARQQAVSALFMRHGLALAAVGVAFGLAAAAGLTRLMSSLLFGVGAVDLTTYSLVAAGLTAAVLVASYIPARRAASVDPMETLRSE